jgi:hypothetical protein
VSLESGKRVSKSHVRGLQKRVEESARVMGRLLEPSQAADGCWQIHALLKRQGRTWAGKTVWEPLLRRGWRSISRTCRVRSGRRHVVRVHGASAITGIERGTVGRDAG